MVWPNGYEPTEGVFRGHFLQRLTDGVIEVPLGPRRDPTKELGVNPTMTLVANSILCSRGRLQRGESGATGLGYRPPRPPVIEAHHIDRRRRQEVLEMRLSLPDVATSP
jgi:hypothetical protein